MPRRLPWLLALLLALAPAFAGADTYPRQPAIDVQHYTFRLSLDDASDAVIGTATVDVRFVTAGVTTLALDLVGRGETPVGMSVDAVTRDGRPLVFTHASDRLTIALDSPSAAGDRRQFTVVYHGTPDDGLIIAKNRHGDRTFFGDNFPDRAHHWLPTIDHPSDKATCDFIVEAPEAYQVVAAGRLVEETSIPGGRRLTHWRESAPIATYLMVIGVARFAVEYVDVVGGVPVETWVYPQDRDGGFFDFARTRRVLEFFSDRIGPYAYEKLANVQSTTRYGGMENASNVFYSERIVDGSRKIEGTVAHEVAHQWFGDAVTESDWAHVWLSEGFATYFSHLFDEWSGGRDRLEEDMRRDRESVIRHFARNPDLRIVDERVPIRRVLSPYTYEKGGWVLHMLRRRVGDEAFWTGVRAYYRDHLNGNALSADFERAMEEASGQDLTAFFHQWLDEPGHPKLRVTWRYDAPAKTVRLDVEQLQDAATFTFALDVALASADGRAPRIETLAVNQKTQSFSLPADAAPAGVTLDPHAWLLFEGAVTSSATAGASR